MSPKTKDRVGELLAGRFRLDAKLGEGGMGSVYKAFDTQLERPVAVKLIKADLARDAHFAARFKREAKVAARFNHPNSIQVYDYSAGDAGEFYMVLEFVQGHELKDLIRAKSGLSPWRTVKLITQVLSALSAAHAEGIVHRDLKPANIMVVGDDERVKILDFGIAKMRDKEGGAASEALTVAGQIMGTLVYMSPEQTEGSDVDARSDLYAMGVILFECLTGMVPFRAKSAIEIIRMHQREAVPALETLRTGLPPEFDAIVQRAMAKHREDRYADAAEFKGALEALNLVETPTSRLPSSSSARRGAELDETVSTPDVHHGGDTASFYDGLVGRTLDNEYLIQEKLGEGGMGAVFRAKSSLVGNTVALKVIHPALAEREDVRTRFLREARAALEFIHPNAIPTRACRKTQDGLLYMTLDFSPGKDLRTLLKEHGRLAPERAIGLVRQALLALAEAHRKKIVHRDLKPANMLVELTESGDEHLRVCDFGIAKIMDSAEGEGQGLTGRQVIGTPHYMAPEQAGGEGVDARTDLYAMGCVLYELLTGKRLFNAKSTMDVLMKQMTRAPIPPRERTPEANLSAEVEAVVLKALEKDPADRYPTADAFLEAIDALPLNLPQGSFRTTSERRAYSLDDARTVPPKTPAGVEEPSGNGASVLAMLVVMLIAIGVGAVVFAESLAPKLPPTVGNALTSARATILGSGDSREGPIVTPEVQPPGTDPDSPETPGPDPEPDTPDTTSPDTGPDTPDTDPGTPATDPETGPETPDTDPDTPDTDPDTPDTDPETDPDTPDTDPETDPDTPDTDPETDPDTPDTVPETGPETTEPETEPETAVPATTDPAAADPTPTEPETRTFGPPPTETTPPPTRDAPPIPTADPLPAPDDTPIAAPPTDTGPPPSPRDDAPPSTGPSGRTTGPREFDGSTGRESGPSTAAPPPFQPRIRLVRVAGLELRLAKLPEQLVRVDGRSTRVRDAWLSDSELTVGQYARLLDAIKKPGARRRFAMALKPYKAPGASSRYRTIDGWGLKFIDPRFRDTPMRGIPFDAAQAMAQKLGLRLPSAAEWTLAASLRATRSARPGSPNTAGVSGLTTPPMEWLDDGRAGDATSGASSLQTPSNASAVGIRFAETRKE